MVGGANAERSVVRVVAVSHDEFGALIGFGHGSGFAVGANRVLTSAHLIPANDSARVSLFVVGGNAKTDAAARLFYIDRSKDLALLHIDGSLPALTILDGAIPAGANVFALGYPGNVDLATSRSLSDYLAPKDAVRSQGHFANRRTVSGIDALLHTAAIARGNSGGPLLDECGRVLGVNSFTTNSGNGDAPFGFAISNKVLQQFLRAAGQRVTKVALPCLSPAERLAAEQAKASQKRERVVLARRAQEEAELREREQSAAALQRVTENWIAGAILCGLLSLVALGAAGLLFARERVRLAAGLTTVGLLLAVAGAAVFFARPTRSDVPVPASDEQLVPNVTIPGPELEIARPDPNDIVESGAEATDVNTTTPEEFTVNGGENLPEDSASEDDPLWTRDAPEVDNALD